MYDVSDGALHVAYEPQEDTWWAVGQEGSYGGHINRDAVIMKARRASLVGQGGRRRIVVHAKSGRAAFIITSVRLRAPEALFIEDEGDDDSI